MRKREEMNSCFAQKLSKLVISSQPSGVEKNNLLPFARGSYFFQLPLRQETPAPPPNLLLCLLIKKRNKFHKK